MQAEVRWFNQRIRGDRICLCCGERRVILMPGPERFSFSIRENWVVGPWRCVPGTY